MSQFLRFLQKNQNLSEQILWLVKSKRDAEHFKYALCCPSKQHVQRNSTADRNGNVPAYTQTLMQLGVHSMAHACFGEHQIEIPERVMEE